MKQWYQFDIVSHFGEIDREGNYWQPDANLAVPFDYPVTALLPGTITSVQVTSWGQTVITQRLDAPLNRLATHMFFEHLGSSTIAQNQRVTAGQLLGYTAGTSVGILLGVGLYSGDVYGSGEAWTILQNDLKPGGQGLLNPTKLLEDAKNGVIEVPGYTGTAINGSSSSGTDLLSKTGVYIAENIFKIPDNLVTANENIPKLIGGIFYAGIAIAAITVFMFLGGI